VEITATQAQGKLPVTIFRVSGDIDGSNYQDLIARGEQAVQTGARALLIDLGGTAFISTAGMIALYTLAKMMQNAEPVDFDMTKENFREPGWKQSLSRQRTTKLLNLQPMVRHVLDMAGFLEFFEDFTDEAEALTSFH